MRLGLWFWPLGSTQPIPYLLYLAMEEVLPFAMAKWQIQVTAKQPSTGTQAYELVPVGEELVHDANDNDDEESDARPADQVRRSELIL